MPSLAHASEMVPISGPANNKKRKIVVVLGMHRSGTSLLTNLLNILGVDLGEDLLAGNDYNELGHWENESIYRAQDELLNYIAKDWGEIGFMFPYGIDWKRLPEFRTFRDQLISIVSKEMVAANGIWGFKDPRTCRLLPLWKQIFAELGLEPLYVLAIRNPADVADSLLRRNQFDPLHSELVWLLYTLDAVRDAGSAVRIVVDYDCWFAAPREQAQAVAKALDLPWPADDTDLMDRLTKTIRSDLRHSKAAHTCRLPFVAKTYELLKYCAATNTAPDDNVVGELRRCFDCLAAALELSAGAGRIALALGQAELRVGNVEAALAAFTRATRLQPRLASAHASMGLALQSLGRWSEAWDSANKTLALDPTDLMALRVLAKCQSQMGQTAAAEQTCRLILQQDACDADALQLTEESRQIKEKAQRAADNLFGHNAPRVASVPTITPAPTFRPLKGLAMKAPRKDAVHAA